MKWSLFFIALMLLVTVVSAEDLIVGGNGNIQVSAWPGEMHYTEVSPNGTANEAVILTDVDSQELTATTTDKVNDNSVVYDQKNNGMGLCAPQPIGCIGAQTTIEENVTYNPATQSLEQTVWMSQPHDFEYNVELNEGQSLTLDNDGNAEIVNDNPDPSLGYIFISKPVGTDANGQMVTNITYTINGTQIVWNFPAQGDDGQDITYPLDVDPIIDHRYQLVLLLHGNLEPPSMNTQDYRDSSRYFAQPFAYPNSTWVNLNTSQVKYGNASIYLKTTATFPTNVTVPDANQYIFGLNNWSICGWVYWPVAVPAHTYIYRHGDSGSPTEVLDATPTGITYTDIGNGGGQSASYSTTLSPNIWYQVCAIQNGTTLQLYLNGTAVGSTGTRGGSMTHISEPVRIGELAGTGAQSAFIDEVSIFNGPGGAPTIDQLLGEYPLYLNESINYPNTGYGDDNNTVSLLHFNDVNGGKNFTDQIGNRSWATPATLSPTVNTTNYKFGPATGWFLGSSSNLTAAPSTNFDWGTGNFTIEAWVDPMGYPAPSAPIFSTMRYSSGNPTGYILTAENTGAVGFYINGTSAVVSPNLTTPAGVLPLNTYSHVAVVRNANNLAIYINGTLQASETLPAGFGINSYGHNLEISSFYDDIFTRGLYGDMDELRISNVPRWTTTFTPPVDPYEVINNQTFTTSPAALPNTGTVQFSDATPSSAWTGNTFLWSFGDGGTSTLQNPSHTYSSIGSWGVTEQVSNNNMTSYLTQNYPVGAPVVNFAGSPMSGTAALLVTFTDQTTNATPITSYNMSFGDGQFSYTQGPWQHVYSTFGTYTVNLTETNSVGTGYNNKVNYIITSTLQNQQQTFYTPHQTRYKIVDGMNNPVPNATILEYYVSTSLPNGNTTWLAAAYGIPISVAQDMTNSNLAYTATTGMDGYATLTQHGSIYYVMYVSSVELGITNYTVKLMPLDDSYILRIQSNPYINAVANNTYAKVNGTLFVTIPNATYLRLNMTYQDISGYTTDVNHYIWDGNNGTMYRSVDLGNPGTGIVSDYMDFYNLKGMYVIQNYTAVRTTP